MDKVYQASLLQALAKGYYDGVISVKELKSFGDTAIGTFEGADGELIMVDGICYKAKVDGLIDVAKDSELIPFCNTAKFVKNNTFIISCNNITDLKNKLNILNKNYLNNFIIIKINGLFKQITVRSLPKQNKPYKPLDYIVDNEQKVYSYDNINGTIIIFKAPSFMNNLNTTDYHMHFISSDFKYGGHVLDVSFDNIEIEVSVKNKYELILPTSNEFNNTNFSLDSEIIKKIEE